MRTRTRLAVAIAVLVSASPLLLLLDSPLAAWVRCTFSPDKLTGWNLAYGLWLSLVVGTGLLWLLWYGLGTFLKIESKPCWTRVRASKVGFPPCTFGFVERLVFTPVAAFLSTEAIAVAVGAWLGLKMAAVWNRHADASADQQTEAMRALLLGALSLIFAAVGGRIAAGSLLW